MITRNYKKSARWTSFSAERMPGTGKPVVAVRWGKSEHIRGTYKSISAHQGAVLRSRKKTIRQDVSGRSYWNENSDEWSRADQEEAFEEEDSFPMRMSSFVRATLSISNGYIETASKRLVRYWKLDLPESTVAFCLRGMAIIFALVLLRLLLSLFLGIFILGFVAFFLYNVFFKGWLNKKDWDDYGVNQEDSSRTDDTIDVRIWQG